jgi:hypothetical protein
MKKILHWLAARRPKREIKGENNEPYLERYYLFHIGPVSKPWVVGYLHRFVASDPDRGYHDHPWNWAASLILSGRYEEHVPIAATCEAVDVRVRQAGSVSGFGPNHKHRVVLRWGECWTLFVHGRWVRPWGFWRYVAIPTVPARPLPFIALHYEEYANKSTAGWWRR